MDNGRGGEGQKEIGKLNSSTSLKWIKRGRPGLHNAVGRIDKGKSNFAWVISEKKKPWGV